MIEILGLGADASEADILKAVALLQDNAKAAAKAGVGEKAIADKIAQSGGALNREQAIEVLKHQAEAEKAGKKDKKK